SALLQGVGRPDLTALLHVIELPFYLLSAWLLIRARGIEGAALAWTARTALDLALFLAAARWVLPGGAETVRRLPRPCGLVWPGIAIGALPAGLAFRAPFFLLVAVTATIVTWRLALAPEEKASILGVWAVVGRGRDPIPAGVVSQAPVVAELKASSLG